MMMEYRTLGRTKLKISRIGFGGGPIQSMSAEKASSLLALALDGGINYIDLDKRCDEGKVAEAIAKRRKEVIIATKSDAATSADMKRDVDDSLARLKTDYIDIYQLHLVLDEKDLKRRMKNTYPVLEEARKAGKIRHIGITGHNIELLTKAIKTGNFDTVLVPYNIGHTMAAELIDLANGLGVGVLSMKPLGGGFLVDPKFDGEKPKKGAEMMTLSNAMDFVLSNENLSCVLVGVNDAKQLNELLDVEKKHKKLGAEELAAMDARVKEFLGEDYCRTCKYCMPCMFDGIDSTHSLMISEILRLHGYYFRYGYKKTALKQYEALPVRIEHCRRCTVCEIKCPYSIPILKQFEEIDSAFKGIPLKEQGKAQAPTAKTIPVAPARDKKDIASRQKELEAVMEKNEGLLALEDIKIAVDPKTKMPRRVLGRTKLAISEIGFGCGPFKGPEFSQDLLEKLVGYAVKNGINFLETAKDYDQTKVIKAVRAYREQLIVATKSTSCKREELLADIQAALKLFGIDYIDIYQLHSTNSEGELDLKLKSGAADALQEARSKGWIKHTGITGHHIPTLLKAIKTGHFDTVQVPYNLGHMYAEELFSEVNRLGVGVIAMKPLGGGLLVDPKTGPESSKKEAKDLNVKNALSFVLSSPFISTALVGMRSEEQILECCDAVKSKVTGFTKDTKMEILKSVNDMLGEDYCRTCKYCMPCAVNGWEFEIDKYLRYYDFYLSYGYSKYREEYNSLPMKADQCKACGACESKCPYGVNIIEKLRMLHELLYNGP